MRPLPTAAALTLIVLGVGLPEATLAQPPADPPLYESATFPLLPILRANVRFRVAIYGEYDSGTQLYYDRKKLDTILWTMSLRGAGGGGGRRRVLAERRRVAGALARLSAGKRKNLSRLEARLWAAYEKTPALLKGAASRIGTRTGWKDHFAAGLRRLAQYRPSVEAVLERHGLSKELVALAMTESLFSPKARSWAGAGGYWQFLKKTGKKYLHINRIVDERRDPLVSTDAAARMLKEMRAEFKDWPLVIAAYNYGPHRIARGVKKLGTTDLAVLMQKWGPLKYMLNSRSYYASFLGALHVMQHQERYFPGLKLPDRLGFDTWPLPRSMTLKKAASACGVTTPRLVALNPALTRAARTRLALPSGYPLRLPKTGAARCGPASTRAEASESLVFTRLPASERSAGAGASGAGASGALRAR